MASMSIGGNAMTDEVENTAYQFVKFPYTERNGLGEAVSGGYGEATFNYQYLSLEGMQYWATTICAGLPSKTHTSASLFSDMSVLTSYTNCVVFYPTYEAIEGPYYRGVTVKIEQIS
jgi:hypothetical protein